MIEKGMSESMNFLTPMFHWYLKKNDFLTLQCFHKKMKTVCLDFRAFPTIHVAYLSSRKGIEPLDSWYLPFNYRTAYILK